MDAEGVAGEGSGVESSGQTVVASVKDRERNLDFILNGMESL